MTINEWVFWTGTAEVVYDTAVVWALVLLYGTQSNWQMFEEGQAFLATKSVFALVLTYITGLTLQADPGELIDYPQRGLVRILVFAMVGVVFTWWLVLVIRNLRRSKQHSEH